MGTLFATRETSHLESWNPPGDFRSRISHDAIPQIPLPNALLLLTLVPLIWCSSITETCLQDTTNLYSCHCVNIPSRLQICSNLYDFTIRPQKLRNFWEAGQNYTEAEKSLCQDLSQKSQKRSLESSGLSLSNFTVRGLSSFDWSDLHHMPPLALGLKLVPPALRIVEE